MLDTFKIYTDLKESMEEIAAEKIAGVVGLLYEELRQSVSKILDVLAHKSFGPVCHDLVVSPDIRHDHGNSRSHALKRFVAAFSLCMPRVG